MDIHIQNLSFTYPGGVEALGGINLYIGSGDKVAILGQNGAGKTTLVRHFNGLLKPTSGLVKIGDWDTREYTIAQMAARVGYVFQNPDDQLFSRTVRAEISFGPKNLGYPHDKVELLVHEAITLTDLSGHENTNPYDLSPSWRKMVAMASIVAMDTPILILDEPTTGQDAVNIERISHLIEILHTKGKTIVTITHDIDFCAENFDRIIVMGLGNILLDGPVDQVVQQSNVLAETYVDPPQLIRLGKRLGIPGSSKNPHEFIENLRKFSGKGGISSNLAD